jgi:hypothetical protein
LFQGDVTPTNVTGVCDLDYRNGPTSQRPATTFSSVGAEAAAPNGPRAMPIERAHSSDPVRARFLPIFLQTLMLKLALE